MAWWCIKVRGRELAPVLSGVRTLEKTPSTHPGEYPRRDYHPSSNVSARLVNLSSYPFFCRG
jgi:hypothetical protein